MNYQTEKALKAQVATYFEAIQPPSKRIEVEAMYEAFKARLMLELRVSGGANQGVVYGHLEKR